MEGCGERQNLDDFAAVSHRILQIGLQNFLQKTVGPNHYTSAKSEAMTGPSLNDISSSQRHRLLHTTEERHCGPWPSSCSAHIYTDHMHMAQLKL